MNPKLGGPIPDAMICSPAKVCETHPLLGCCCSPSSFPHCANILEPWLSKKNRDGQLMVLSVKC